jgi:hypothetical protein
VKLLPTNSTFAGGDSATDAGSAAANAAVPNNVFYTQNDDFPTKPPLFTNTWLENARPRIQNYDYVNQENPVESVGVAKNYMYNRYGIPSSTYEVGDETDRTAIREAAKIFAEELMQLMLAQSYE